MEYSLAFMRQHEEMCQVVGSIVFALAEAGHDSRGGGHCCRAAQ